MKELELIIDRFYKKNPKLGVLLTELRKQLSFIRDHTELMTHKEIAKTSLLAYRVYIEEIRLHNAKVRRNSVARKLAEELMTVEFRCQLNRED